MVSLLRQKFAQPKFCAKLLATGDQHIAESNDWGDKFWGVCLNDDGVYKGENLLGILLMQIRDELRAAGAIYVAPA